MYFFGLDQFYCLTENQEKSLNCISTPLNINAITNIHMRLDLIVFQKVGHESTWFVKGLGIPNEKELISGTLNISNVCLTSNGLIGSSNNNNTNTLYKLDFKMSSDTENMIWSLEKVKQLDQAIQIKQIITNDDTVYGLDDFSGIYEISDTITLKWRLEGVTIVKIASGFGHFIALSDTGALYSWGCGGRGELGHADHDHAMVNCELPKRIEFFDDLPCIVKDVCCGGWHTMALTSDGDVYSWGWNESGQLGHSKEKISVVTGQPYPIDLGSADDPITQIATGARHSIIIFKSGKIFSFGLNKHGQLGVGDLENRHEPEEIKYEFDEKPVRATCGRWCTFIYTTP